MWRPISFLPERTCPIALRSISAPSFFLKFTGIVRSRFFVVLACLEFALLCLRELVLATGGKFKALAVLGDNGFFLGRAWLLPRGRSGPSAAVV